MKKIVIALSSLTLYLILSSPSFASTDNIKIDESLVSKGVIRVSIESTADKGIKVMVSKDDTRYTYDLKSDGTLESFPLQLGNGEYTISVLENIGGTRFRPLKTKKVQIQLENSDIVFLNSIQNVKWEPDYQAIKKSSELVKDETLVDRRVRAIYNFIIKNITYDYEKLAYVQTGYIPDIEQTYISKDGICYDYSSLFAAMKRSEGLPTKLVMGYTKNVEGYHAWNEVLIDGKWVIIDSTVDSVWSKANVKYEMIKNPKDYIKVLEY